MAHDQVWKEVLWTFFAEFMQLFFPDAALGLDFERLRLIEGELFTDLPSGARREPDLLVEAHTKEGAIELIMVHIEVQRKREKDVPYRMWEYYSLLRLRRKRPVFPVVVYLAPGTGGLTEESHTESLFGRDILAFRYAAVGLPDLPAEQYLERENVLAPALSALMRSGEVTRVMHKLRMYQRMTISSLDEARRSLLLYVMDSYLKLNQSEEEELRRLVEQPELQEVKEMLTTYEERGIQKGIQQGIVQGVQQGIVQGQRRTLLLMMRRKFGNLPDSVQSRVESITDSNELDSLSERLIAAATLDEMDLS